MRYIGDVHGKISEYQKIIHCQYSIQVGDFGIGFVDVPEIPVEHRFIRGNHDRPDLCKASPNYIPDGHCDMWHKAVLRYFIGGGFSRDRSLRLEGRDWWREEELTIRELDRHLDAVTDLCPKVMVTHECPSGITQQLFGYNDNNSRTASALEAIRCRITPKLWIFGHHHEHVDKTIDGTRFICLGELDYIDLYD